MTRESRAARAGGPVPALRRGDVFWIDLDPARGNEATKSRPAVVVSNDGVNTAVHRHGRGVVTVVPVTTNTARVYPFQVLLKAAEHPGLRIDSKAQAEQVRTVDVTRIGRRVTVLSPAALMRLDAALRLHLSL